MSCNNGPPRKTGPRQYKNTSDPEKANAWISGPSGGQHSGQVLITCLGPYTHRHADSGSPHPPTHPRTHPPVLTAQGNRAPQTSLRCFCFNLSQLRLLAPRAHETVAKNDVDGVGVYEANPFLFPPPPFSCCAARNIRDLLRALRFE